MRLKIAATAIAIIGSVSLLAAPADAAPKKKRVVYAQSVVYTRGHTVQVSRDEDGRTRRRVIIQKRSYLDPGTEQFPGERSVLGYATQPNYRASGILDNTTFGGNQTALPNVWTLPGRNNPWIGINY